MLTRRSYAAVALAACDRSIQPGRDATVPIPAGATCAHPTREHADAAVPSRTGASSPA
jgi:hypothetical protein